MSDREKPKQDGVPTVPMLRDGNGWVDPYVKLRQRDAELEELCDEIDRLKAAPVRATDPVRAAAEGLIAEWVKATPECPITADLIGAIGRLRAVLAAEPVQATDPVRAALREAAEWLWQCHDALMRGEDDPGIGDAWNALRAALAADREPEPVQITDEMVERAADVAYGVYHPATHPTITGKERAWRGPVATNPMRRAVRAALAAALAVPPPEGESE